MTRREIYFYDKNSLKLYVTPEFNGDKEEFDLFKKHGDSCDKNWDEIIKEFENVKTLDEFKIASNKAQSYYHSFLGDSILPIKEAEKVTYNNEIYMINSNSEIYLYNPTELTREYLINVANKGVFEYCNFEMQVEKYKTNYSESIIYELNLKEIPNIATPKGFHLGAIEDLNFTANLDEFIRNDVDTYIKNIEKMKANLEQKPIKLKLVCSPNNNFPVAFEDDNKIKYVLDPGSDYFALVKVDTKMSEPEYNLNHPVDIEGKVLYPIYDSWLGEPIFNSNELDIKGLKMASKLNRYMSINENIIDIGSENANLNDIYKDIYNPEKIEKNLFDRYKEDSYTNILREEYYKFLEEKNIIAEISNVEDEEEDYEPTD